MPLIRQPSVAGNIFLRFLTFSVQGSSFDSLLQVPSALLSVASFSTRPFFYFSDNLLELFILACQQTVNDLCCSYGPFFNSERSEKIKLRFALLLHSFFQTYSVLNCAPFP